MPHPIPCSPPVTIATRPCSTRLCSTRPPSATCHPSPALSDGRRPRAGAARGRRGAAAAPVQDAGYAVTYAVRNPVLKCEYATYMFFSRLLTTW